MSAITLKSVEKKYGKVHAVRGISMDVGDGEFVSFVGPSGCGKTSTMRMIAGLEEITGGDILFDGESVIRKKPSQRRVAMSFENYALYPSLSVYENIAFPLRSAKVKNSEVDRRVRELAEVVGITDLLPMSTEGLSSGQSQAIGLARALIRKPSVLLLDEPISHQDIGQRFQMRTYIKRLHIDLGYTMILVTHDQEDAMSMADKVAVMEAGRLHQIASPRQIYDNPVDLFVASFIGDIPMNFLDCNAIFEYGKTTLIGEGFRIAVPECLKACEMKEQMVLGIRPYDLAIHDSEDETTISAETVMVERFGDMNLILARCGNITLQIAASIRNVPNKGEIISLKVSENKAKLFDKKSGLALVY